MSSNRQAVTVWVNLENLARLDEMAAALGRSRSGHAGLLLASAIEERFAKRQRQAATVIANQRPAPADGGAIPARDDP